MKTIFFDISNVLIFYTYDDICGRILSDINSSQKNNKIYLKFLQDLVGKYQLGKISTNSLYETLQGHSDVPLNFQELLSKTCLIFKPNEKIIPLLDQLKLMGVNLIILSNTCELHYNYLTSTFPHFSYFNGAILSYEVGCCKPSEIIYKKALQDTKGSSSDCYYIDDSKENINAAKRVGLDGYCFDSVDNLKKNLIKKGFLFERMK